MMVNNPQYSQVNENPEEDEPAEGQGNVNEKSSTETYNYWSLLTFSWLSKTISLSNKRQLEASDLPLGAGQEATKLYTERLERAWCDAVETKETPQLWKCIPKIIPWKTILIIAIFMLVDTTSRVLQVVFLSQLLEKLMFNGHRTLTKEIYLYAAGVCLSGLALVVSRSQNAYLLNVLGIHVRSALTGLVYKKVLQLKQDELAKVSSGHVINLVSKDMQPVPIMVTYIPSFLFSTLELIIIIPLLWILVGKETLACVAFVLLVGFLVTITSKILLAPMRRKTTVFTDTRLSLVEAAISGIRVVKMNAWEWLFSDWIGQARRKEISVIRCKNALVAIVLGVYSTFTPLTCFAAMVTLILTGHGLTPQIVFTTYSLLGVVGKMSFQEFIFAIYYLSQGYVSIQRMEDFLIRGLRSDDSSSLYRKQHKECVSPTAAREVSSTSGHSLSLVNVSCKRFGSEFNGALHRINLELYHSQMVAITGPVGSGKSSVLQAIMGELEAVEGEIFCSGRMAYVSQIPWLFSGTIRENITFGKELNEERYLQIVSACGLQEDFELFPSGDLTLIGQRGISLSGGQRARVSLARAVYDEADIYLLDDPLSAVDAKVSEHIFTKCVCGLLANRPRLLVIHQLQYLNHVDHVIVMDKGMISNQGSFQELVDTDDYLGILKETESATVDEHIQIMIDKEVKDLESDLELAQEGTGLEESDVGMETATEDRESGTVSYKTYLKYFTTGNAIIFLVFVAIAFVLPDTFYVFTDFWLANLSRKSQEIQRKSSSLYHYGSFVLACLIAACIRAFLNFHIVLKSAEKLHNNMFIAVMKAPVRFFDTNPVGRIMNRFSKDVGAMDELLPLYTSSMIRYLLFAFSSFVVATVANYWVVFISVPVMIVMLLLTKYYLCGAREIKRIECINTSPVFAHIADTIHGISTIRAYDKQEEFCEALYRRQDDSNHPLVVFQASIRWLSLRMDGMCVFFLTTVTFIALFTSLDAAMVGVSLSYVIQLVGTALWTVMAATSVENYMTSVERVISYSQIEPEPGYAMQTRPPKDWPTEGRLELNDVSLTYYPGGPQVLKGISCEIKAREKIGIVGRTGAGKSSLLAALFRMPEPDGRIDIDNVCVNDLNVQDYRSRIAVIPQNPFLITTSLRANLDPFERHDDEAVWKALEQVQMKTHIQQAPAQLNYHVTEKGSNFSVGERQLLCLARAVLQDSRIIVIDEATANVDLRTDQLVQETIRNQLSDYTVLTIAHRLDTIIDYDKIMVFENGRIIEFDQPQALLAKEGGYFAQLYQSHILDQNSRNV